LIVLFFGIHNYQRYFFVFSLVFCIEYEFNKENIKNQIVHPTKTTITSTKKLLNEDAWSFWKHFNPLQ